MPAARPTLHAAPFVAVSAAACAALWAATLSAQTPIASERPRVLILTSGEVYGGLVTEYSYGVKVRSANGSVVLPADRIQANADTLDGAFLQLRGRVPRGDATGRAKLASWALSHGLPLRAREELLAALELEPNRDDWLRALRRVEGVIAASRGGSGAGAGVVPASHTASRDGAVASATAATGGLSGETLRSFTGQVERVLLTRCGNAGCHGGTDAGAFQLTNPSRSAATTRINLAAALAFVQGGTTSAPLLTACVDRPDRRGRTPFRVQGGPASRALLIEWVARVAAERPDLAAAPPAATAAAPLRSAAGPANETRRETLSEIGGAAPPPRPIQPDTFDPAEFNRTFAAPVPPDADSPK